MLTGRLQSGLLLLALGWAQAYREGMVSALPLITQLQHENENLQPVHPQPRPSWIRRQLTAGTGTLNAGNTAPLRIKVDTRSLYEAHAPLYSACFQVGAWFRRGLPDQQPNPPANGVATCVRGPGEQLSTAGCWGRCEARDIITAADRAKILEVVSSLTGEVSGLLATPPEPALSFTISQSTYYRALQAKGYPTNPSCAADCEVLSGVAVDPAYCTAGAGYGYDVILSVTKPPGITGVAGTGSHCAANQAGRPLWIVLAWHSTIVGIASSATSQLISQYRGFVIHEIMHGLGFVNSMFNYATDANGVRKHLIRLGPVTDLDGATDEVWYFTKGRAYEVAKTFFACQANTTGPNPGWSGLPLMGLPEAGRAAHWETRIMRDDVMSYGFQHHVSSITLAAMEDLGFYLANYSNAGCMLWGHLQGCAYVTTRCGTMTHASSQMRTVEGSGGQNGRDLCSGDPFWGSHPDSYLTSKCARGNDPCDTTSDAGFALAACPDGTTGCHECDAQCARDPLEGRSDCTSSGLGDPEGSSGKSFSLSSIDWQAWLIPLIMLLSLVLAVQIVRPCICPKSETARTISYFLLLVVGAIAAGLTAGTVLLYQRREMYEAYIGLNSIMTSFGIGVGLLIFVVSMGFALATRRPCLLRVGYWTLWLICLAEVIAAFIVCYWIYSLGAIPNDQLDSLFGDARGSITGFLDDVLEKPMTTAEGLVCMTYQKCCRDPALDMIDLGHGGNRSNDYGVDSTGVTNFTLLTNYTIPAVISNATATCMSPGEHSSFNDLDATLKDPSTPNFCSYVTGASRAYLSPPPGGICNLIEEMGGYSLSQCQDQFCSEGIDGYLDFVTMFVELLQRYAWPIGIAMCTLVVIELVLAQNLKHSARLARQENSVIREKKSVQVRMRAPTYTEDV